MYNIWEGTSSGRAPRVVQICMGVVFRLASLIDELPGLYALQSMLTLKAGELYLKWYLYKHPHHPDNLIFDCLHVSLHIR